jgi:hypothetical protein
MDRREFVGSTGDRPEWRQLREHLAGRRADVGVEPVPDRAWPGIRTECLQLRDCPRTVERNFGGGRSEGSHFLSIVPEPIDNHPLSGPAAGYGQPGRLSTEQSLPAMVRWQQRRPKNTVARDQSGRHPICHRSLLRCRTSDEYQYGEQYVDPVGSNERNNHRAGGGRQHGLCIFRRLARHESVGPNISVQTRGKPRRPLYRPNALHGQPSPEPRRAPVPGGRDRR